MVVLGECMLAVGVGRWYGVPSARPTAVMGREEATTAAWARMRL